MQVVEKMSKDSAHARNEARKQAAVEEKIRALKEKASKISSQELQGHWR